MEVGPKVALVHIRKVGLYNPFASPQSVHRLPVSEPSGSLITLISCDFATNLSLIYLAVRFLAGKSEPINSLKR